MRRLFQVFQVHAALVALLIGTAQAGVNQWTAGGPAGGQFVALITDPQNEDFLYAGVHSGQVFRSTDRGTTWRAVNTGLSGDELFGLVAAPGVGGRLYAGTSEGLFESTDGGEKWQRIITGHARGLAMDPSDANHMYASDSSIYHSSDGGTTWEAVYTDYFGLPEQATVSRTGTVYVVNAGAEFLRSTDRGRTWVKLPLPGTAARSTGLTRLRITDANVVYAYGIDGLYESRDEGTSWIRRSPSLGRGGLFIDARGRLYVAAADLFRSDDGGSHWTLVTSRFRDLDGAINITFDATDPARFYVAPPRRRSGPIAVTTNGGADWSDASEGIVNTSIGASTVHPTDPNVLYVSDAYTSGAKSTDGGRSWGAGGPAQAKAIAIDPGNPSTMYAAGSAGILKSTDGGATWTASGKGVPQEVSTLAIDPSSPSTLYVGAYWDGVYKSLDGGATWLQIVDGRGTDQIGPIQQIAIAPSRPATIYAAGGYATIRSDDAGVSWRLAGGGAFRIAVDRANPDLIYAISMGHTLGISDDGGRTWRAGGGLSLRTPFLAVAADPNRANTVYLGDETTAGAIVGKGLPATTAAPAGRVVYRSRDAGRSWVPLANPLMYATTIQTLNVAPSDSSIIYAGTESSGVFAISLEPVPGDANDDYSVSVADVFYLINYLFAGGSAPGPSADANGDKEVTVADAFYLINYLFRGGPAPR